MRKILLSTLFSFFIAFHTATYADVAIENCGKSLTFDKTPERLIIHDINMSEMAFALDLQDKIVGLTGISGWYKTSTKFDKKRGNIPELAPKYPTIENLLAANPDLFFAGWYYGMKPGGEVTPQTLAPFGIKTIVLTESCVHLNKDNVPEASMNLLFDDVRRLGKVMQVEEKAEILVKQWQSQLRQIQEQYAGKEKIRVFLLDGPADSPFTSGHFAIPHAMIKAAGGKNIVGDMQTSWGRTSWENVATKNPEFLILLDYQTGNGATDTFKFLQEHPIMAHTDAVKNKRWIGLRYEELTPGPANIDAIMKIADAMHSSTTK